jgi:hypothetical protein
MPLLTIVVNGFDSNIQETGRGERGGLGGYLQAYEVNGTSSIWHLGLAMDFS